MATIVKVVQWAVQTATLPGQTECGDLHAVVAEEHRALVAVVDGVGHGPDAAAAAARAVDIIEEHGVAEPLTSLVKRCHARLSGGRGVVMSVGMFDAKARTLTWLGVGNVAGALRRKAGAFSRRHETLLLRSGVVGKQLPELRTATVPVARDDVLILATDGVRSDFADDVKLRGEPQQIADDLLARHRKRTDDALVLVARFLG